MTNIPRPKIKRFYAKWWFWLIIVIILMIGGCSSAGYVGYQKTNSKQDSFQENTTVSKHDLKKTIELEGEIKSKKQVDLFFQANGTVIETNVSIGDFVKKDQLLAKIDTDVYTTTKYKEIKAPFDGIITEVNIFNDMAVSAQTSAITLESQETEIVTTATENKILDLKKDLAAEITFSSLTDIKLRANISSLAEKKNSAAIAVTSTASTASASGYEIKLNYDKPEDLELKRDLSCNVLIMVDEKSNVLSIPIAALKYEDSKVYVNVKNHNSEDVSEDVVEKKYIELGFEGDEYVEIISGLDENEEIILFSEEDVPKSFGF